MPRARTETPETQNDKAERKSSETLADDQAEHRYYYDDAHGYEDFDPESDDDKDDCGNDSA